MLLLQRQGMPGLKPDRIYFRAFPVLPAFGIRHIQGFVTVAYYKRLMAELAEGQRPCMFPDDSEPDEIGLVRVELSVSSVIEAYTKGCFPWTGSHPVPWFSPDPRLVLFPEQFKVSRSLQRLARQQRFLICFDCNFRAVIENCAAVSRKKQAGTWITENMAEVYCELQRHLRMCAPV
ncbi:MAG: hypothetical protein GY749_10320 [Desulfobacteraceae bacterium]|nr:hypothetical protein [Desulfobacteraceae bacterium]